MTGSVTIMPSGSDIFASDAEVLVNPVDAATGAQGRGLAKLFAQRFPVACMAYKRVARRGAVEAGNVWIHDAGELMLQHDVQIHDRRGRRLVSRTPRWIFFAATKDHWRHQSTIDHVFKAALHIRREAISLGVQSTALPALGCGEGGLAWDEVREILEVEARVMAHAGINVMLYEPHEQLGRTTRRMP